MRDGLDYGFRSHETKVLALILLFTDSVTLGMSFNFLLRLRLCNSKMEQIIFVSFYHIWIIASARGGQMNK